MKRFAILTAAAALSTTAAFAYTGVSPSMIDSVENILLESGMDGVDLTTLTDEQIVEIYAAGQTGNSGDQIGMIRAALDGEGTMKSATERRMSMTAMDDNDGLMPAGENSVVTSVQNWLDKRGFEADASTLTDAQVAQIYFHAYSGDENDNSQDYIETILNQ